MLKITAELKIAMKNAGFFDRTISKQEIYSELKNLIDININEENHKCVSNVCSLTEKIRPEELSKEDIQELTEVAEDLCFYINQASEFGLNNVILEKIKHFFTNVFYSLEFQGEIAPFSNVMGRFSYLIHEYQDSLKELDENQIELLKGFVNDFKKWVTLTYKDKKPTNGLEYSLISGFEQIEAMIKPYSECHEIDLW